MSSKEFGVVGYLVGFGGVYNLGDDIQTIAAERLLPKVDFYIDREKMDVFQTRTGVPACVVMNGWFTHAPNRWPPSKDILPLITSFHVTRGLGASGWPVPASTIFFDEEHRDFLHRFAPIGCRDLDTLAQCQAAGIDSFFSGCLTLTLARPDRTRDPELVVLNDVPLPVVDHVHKNTSKKILLTQHFRKDEHSRYRRTRLAEDLLNIYATASCVITTRLHCVLPCLALGTPVLMLDEAWDQYRFSGLNELYLHGSSADFLDGKLPFDVNAPPSPRTDHLPMAEALVKSVRAFVAA